MNVYAAITWFYVQDGEQKRPVEQSGFEGLVSEGIIGTATLVWQEGMAFLCRGGGTSADGRFRDGSPGSGGSAAKLHCQTEQEGLETLLSYEHTLTRQRTRKEIACKSIH